jgi:S1-C subfamily serine protease
VGFAVPVDIVNQVVPELIKYGRLEKGTLPFKVFDDSLAHRLGVSRGAVVDRITDDAAAGDILSTYIDEDDVIHLGDVVIKVADHDVTGVNDIQKAIDGKKPGEQITVVVDRGKQKPTLKIKLISSLRQGS